MLSGTRDIKKYFIGLGIERVALNPPELTEYRPRHDRHKSTPAPGSSSQRYDNGFQFFGKR